MASGKPNIWARLNDSRETELHDPLQSEFFHGFIKLFSDNSLTSVKELACKYRFLFYFVPCSLFLVAGCSSNY